MPDTVKRTASLIVKYWRKELEEEELNELLDWANHSPANRDAFTRLTDPAFIVDNLRELSMLKQEMRDRIWVELQLLDPDSGEHGHVTEKDNRKNIFTAAFRKKAGAVLLVLVTGLLLFWYKGRRTAAPVAPEVVDADLVTLTDAMDARARCQIRFADGTSIEPAAMSNGSVLENGRLKLVKEPDGVRISNIPHPNAADSSGFTSITTFEGERIRIWLPDGTEVTMNTTSSLRFPAFFNEPQRTVEASGELYFQVPRKSFRGTVIPFVVYTHGMNMESPAARFNVHVYPMEKLATATLEQGSLRVWKQVSDTGPLAAGKHKVDIELGPGQQAQISNSTEGGEMGGIRVEQVNWQEVIKWKTE